MQKNIIRIILISLSILLIPLFAMQFTNEVTWSVGDFIVAFILIAGTGIMYELAIKLASKQKNNIVYQIAVCVALATAFFLVWLNLAVGLIGSENNPANLMYFGVLAIGRIGAVISRLESRRMSRTFYTTAIAQFLVPIIATNIWKPPIDLGLIQVFVLNLFFVMFWVISALLFKWASDISKEPIS